MGYPQTDEPRLRRQDCSPARRFALLTVISLLVGFASQARAQTSNCWGSVAINSHLGWEIHRIIEHARVNGTEDELIGPTELERRVTSAGIGIGPEVTVGWHRWWGRFGTIFATHKFSGDGTSGNYYVRADLGYGRKVGVFVGGRLLNVAYEDKDSTGLADYDLRVLVAGVRCDLRKNHSPWSLRFDGSVGSEGVGAFFDRIEAHELAAVVELDLTIGYRPAPRPYQIELGYYFWSHSNPSRSYVPSSTLIFDKFWEESYPIWHGVMLRTSYHFGPR